MIEKALDAGCQPVSFLMERRHIDGQGSGLLARCGGVPVYTGDRELLAELTGFALTRGILCAMRRPALPEVSALCASLRCWTGSWIRPTWEPSSAPPPPWGWTASF